MKNVRIGIIGTGGISAKHIGELLRCENAQITALCDIDGDALDRRARMAGVPSHKCYTDYRALIADPEVDAVEICTPNCLHAEMARAALAAGKPVNIEKPLAMNVNEALSVLEAEKASGVFGMTCFSYRFMPAVRYAKHLVDAGVIGHILGLNVAYLKCSGLWAGRTMEWRFDKQQAGSGVVGDLGVHLIDLAQLLSGNIIELCATHQIIVRQRPLPDGSGTGTVTTDDTCSFIARFACGAEGNFHITRCAIGHANTIRYDVYGDRGSISFDLNNPDILTVCRNAGAPGEGDPKDYPSECITVPEEFRLMQEQAFVNAVCGQYDALFPTLSDGVQGQRVVDAILASAAQRKWITV